MTKVYSICNLIVQCDFRYDIMINRAEKYLLTSASREMTSVEDSTLQDTKEPDIIIPFNEAAITKMAQENPHLSLAECEVINTCRLFYMTLLKFDGFMLHSSAVVVDDKAYLFSAPSGTGKSTHTEQWLKLFGDKAQILNDDKPAICIQNGSIYAYGTPWSGKSDLNLNLCVPLQGICVLGRSEENYIKPLEQGKAIYSIINQTLRPKSPEAYDKLLSLLDQVMNHVPVWQMGCNISPEAAQIAYDAMSAKR